MHTLKTKNQKTGGWKRTSPGGSAAREKGKWGCRSNKGVRKGGLENRDRGPRDRKRVPEHGGGKRRRVNKKKIQRAVQRGCQKNAGDQNFRGKKGFNLKSTERKKREPMFSPQKRET